MSKDDFYELISKTVAKNFLKESDMSFNFIAILSLNFYFYIICNIKSAYDNCVLSYLTT